jgi:hypothetical protein
MYSMVVLMTKIDSKKDEEQLSKRGRKPGTIYFPRHPLKETLSIPEAVWTQNAGNPFDILDVAKAVKKSPTSSGFDQLLASSYRYGLTEGSLSTKIVSLTPLGSSIVAPTVETDVKARLREALLHPEIFRKVYTWMDRKPIPRDDVFRNTVVKTVELGGFGIPQKDADEFVQVLMQNVSDYGLADDQQGVKYLRLDKLSPTVQPPIREDVTAEGEQKPPVQGEIPAAKIETPPLQIPKQIFVAHGKNKKPLDQMKTILTQFKIPFQVAIDEPHKGRPISAKVVQLMKQCTSGIFIFTADEETTDAQGSKVLRPSDNVVFELGAGIVLYADKIVIFREDGVSFGSDFTDYGHITFEKDKLDAKAFELMKELIGLGFLQVTPT